MKPNSAIWLQSVKIIIFMTVNTMIKVIVSLHMAGDIIELLETPVKF